VAALEGHPIIWESPAVLPWCHRLPSGCPDAEVVLKEDAFAAICRMLSDEEKPMVHTSVCFTFYDGTTKWWFPGES
jgi:hypothetical protein